MNCKGRISKYADNELLRKQISEWERKQRKLGTLKALARRLDIPYPTACGMVHRLRKELV